MFVEVLGCTDATAFNYDPLANTDDGSCIAVVEGCMDATAFNYNDLANTDDGSCIAIVLGCTDETATNYNDLANTDDNSCTYCEDIYTYFVEEGCFEVEVDGIIYTADTAFVIETPTPDGCIEYIGVQVIVNDCAGIEESVLTVGQGPFKVYNTMGQLIPSDRLPKNVMLIKVYANGVSEKFIQIK